MTFINRKKDLSFLKQDYETSSDVSRFLILSGSTGIGKSELVQQVFGGKENFLRVKLANHASAKNIPNLYINELARAVNSKAIENNRYIHLGKFSKQNRLKEFRNIVGEVAGSLSRSSTIEEKLKKPTDHFSISSAEYSLHKNYINNALARHNVIITIENIQNIDYESLLFLEELLIKERGLYVIGEFTKSQDFQIDINGIVSRLEGPNIRIRTYQLFKLDLDEILKECANQPDRIKSILSVSYEKSTGNLHQLQVLTSITNRGEISIFNDESYDRTIILLINSMSKEHQFVLVSIISHGGVVDREILDHYINAPFDNNIIVPHLVNLNKLLEDLEAARILRITNANAEVAQDSVIEEVLNERLFERLLIIANRKWLDFYKQQRGRNEFEFNESEILGKEIYFRAMVLDFSGIQVLLKEVFDLTLISKVPRRIIRYLENLKKSIKKAYINDKNKSKLEFQIDSCIITVLFKLKAFESILNFTEKHLSDDRIFMFHNMSLALSGRGDESLENCSRFLESNKDSAYKELAQLISLCALRTTNQYTRCEEEWNRLRLDGTFDSSPFKGVFLRFSDLCLFNDFKLQLNCIRESIDVFRGNGQIINEISSRVSLAQYFGYDGKLEDAEEQLKQAYVLSRTIFYEDFTLKNNISVLELQRNNSSIEIVKSLESAVTLCDNELDKFIIWINLLVAYSIKGAEKEAESVIRILDQIIDSNRIVDFDLKRIATFNSYVHYEKCNNSSEADIYLSKSRSFKVLSDHEFWNFKLYKKQSKYQGNMRFQMEYYPVYITYWDFDFDRILQSL